MARIEVFIKSLLLALALIGPFSAIYVDRAFAAIESIRPIQIDLSVGSQISGNALITLLSPIYPPSSQFGKTATHVLVKASTATAAEISLILNGKPSGMTYRIQSEQGTFYFHPPRSMAILGTNIHLLELQVNGSAKIESVSIGME